MALFTSQTLKPSLSSSFLPTTIKTLTLTLKSRNPNPKITISCSSSTNKIVRCPSLDRHASLHHRRRFVRKLSTLLLSKPRHFLPLPILRRCRRYLTLPPGRPLLPMIHRYPAFFSVTRCPTTSIVSVSLTPAVLSLFSQISKLSSSSANKLVKLLLLSSHRRLLLSKLVHVAPDLGFSPNFRPRLCNAHPDRFRTVDTSYGQAVELVSSKDDDFEMMPVVERVERDRPIIDRPAKFKKVRLRRGLNVKRKHLDWLVGFGELREINPYLESVADVLTVEEKEKRACTVVREVLGMTVEKRTLVDHLTHFRKEFGLPNRLRAMLVRHPEMFYVSVKGDRDSVFLVEAYDDKGRLVVEDEMIWAKNRLEELVREGKRMRRERRRGGRLFGDDNKIEDDDDGEDEEEEFLEDDDDGFGDLFESGIGDDWDDFGGGNDDIEEVKDIVEFWSLNKTSSERSEVEDEEDKLEAW